MRQRVMIAMALATNPKLLIADEPTTALDVTIQAQILDLMRGLAREFNTALMLITHDLGVVAEMADDVTVMYTGGVVERGTVYQVLKEAKHPYTRGLLNSIPSPSLKGQRLNVIKGAVPNPLNLPKGCTFAPRCPHVMERCRTDVPPLLQLTEGGERFAACWLHDGSAAVPAELSLSVPAAAPSSRPAGAARSAAEPAAGVRAAPEPGSRAEASTAGPASSTTPTAGSLP